MIFDDRKNLLNWCVVTQTSNPLYLRDSDLRYAMELLFFGYRGFTADADRILAEFGFGRDHHRAIYFIGAHDSITVGQLLDILRITKQSLARVLSKLIVEGYVLQTEDDHDRRKRQLSLTEKGRNLEIKLTTIQSNRIARAYQVAGPEAVAGFKTVLQELIDIKDLDRVFKSSSVTE